MARRKSVLSEAADAISKEEATTGDAPTDNSFQRRVALVGDIASGRIDSKKSRFIEPEKCRVWRHHNRLYDLLTPENCEDLISSIEARGAQTVSAIVRPAAENDDGIEFEIIAGARRHFSVSYLRNAKGRKDILYRIEPHDLSDEEAFLIADAENRDREDLSDFERARDYQKALEFYYGGSMKEMAAKLNVAEKWLYNFIVLARMPEEIIALAPDLRQWRRDHAHKLMPLWAKPKEKGKIEKEIDRIADVQKAGDEVARKKPLDANAITKRLIAAAQAAGKGGSKIVKELALGAMGTASVTVTSRKVSIDVVRSKGMDVDKMIARIEKAFK